MTRLVRRRPFAHEDEVGLRGCIEWHYVLHENVVGFHIPVGLSLEASRDLVILPIAPSDLRVGSLFLGQMRGRTLSVASSRFADQLTRAMNRL